MSDMTYGYLAGSLLTLFVFGGYFVAAFRNRRGPVQWREFGKAFTRATTRYGFLRSIAVPACWTALAWGFVVHVRLSLGRWPRFGEPLAGWLLPLHGEVVWTAAGALVFSLGFALLILIVCAIVPGLRHISVYALTYGLAVVTAVGSMMLFAPRPFMNWFLD